jgi:hypothetical protein
MGNWELGMGNWESRIIKLKGVNRLLLAYFDFVVGMFLIG